MKRLYLSDVRGIHRASIVNSELITVHDEGSKKLTEIWRASIASLLVVEMTERDGYLLVDSGSVRAIDAKGAGRLLNNDIRLCIDEYEIYPTLDAAVVAAILQASQAV